MKKEYAIYRVGSSLLLENHKDVDYLYIYERQSDLDKAKKILTHKIEADNHCRLKKDVESNLYIYSYLHHFWEKVKGRKVEPYSIYDHDKEYANLLLESAKSMVNQKHWYHIYLGYCALKNGKDKEFTNTQIKKAQKIHDERKIDEEDKKIIFDYLTNLVNN